MSTSKPVSIWRMFSSSGPHKLASSTLSSGARAISTGFDFGAGRVPACGLAALVFADDNFASQAVRQCRRDADIDEGVDQALIADKVDHPIVVGAAGEFVGVLFRQTFDHQALNAADHRLADHLRLVLD